MELLAVIAMAAGSNLGDDDFAKREKATAVLRTLGPHNIGALFHYKSSRCLEARCRSRHLFERYRAAWLRGRVIRPKNYPYYPWFSSNCPDFDTNHFVHKKPYSPHEGQFPFLMPWMRWREGTKELVFELQKARYSEEYIRNLLNQWIEEEKNWSFHQPTFEQRIMIKVLVPNAPF